MCCEEESLSRARELFEAASPGFGGCKKGLLSLASTYLMAESLPNFLSQDLTWGKPHSGARTVAKEALGIAFAAVLRGEKSCLRSGCLGPAEP